MPASGERRILAQLRRYGLLLKQDKVLPSVVGLITGEALAASWWSHPRAKEIFDLLQALSERSDILETKLIDGKVTFVYEPLWPAWLGVATCVEDWQTAGLSVAAKKLLTEVKRAREREASGPAVKELELRLCVHTEQRHSESGKHVLVLENWANWAKRRAVRALPVPESKRILERAAQALGAPLSALPWHDKRRVRAQVRARAKQR
ncbi:MAG TPA: hypothetical protein VNW92_04365 [Polyangiaceae bacterium]|jgi:hypothetical protein|nr:hypothetical protein [Polyangiaceae bacterium]